MSEVIMISYLIETSLTNKMRTFLCQYYYLVFHFHSYNAGKEFTGVIC